MRQLELTYSASYIGHKAWRGDDENQIGGALAVLNAAIEHLGRKNVLEEIDVNKTTLSEALGEKNDKRVAAEWVFKVLAMLTLKGDERSAELQREILAALAALAPRHQVVDASDEPTPEEIEAAERVLAKSRRRKKAA